MKHATRRRAIESDSHRLVDESDIVGGLIVEVVERIKVRNGSYYPTRKIIIDEFPEHHVTNGVEHVAYHYVDGRDTQRYFVLRSTLLGYDDGGAEHINYWLPYDS